MRTEGWRVTRFAASPAFWPGVFLFAILALDALFIEGFGALQWRDGRLTGTPIHVLHRSVPVLLIALGMTPVIGTRGIDLSVGTVMAMAAAMAALMMVHTSLAVPVVIVLTLLGGLLLGLWNGALVAGLGIQPIVATLILLTSGRGVALIWTEGGLVSFDRPAFQWLSSGSILGLPVSFLVAALVFFLMAALMRRTVFGLYVAAIGDNEASATLAGLPIASLKLAVYGLCGLLAALAGMFVSSEIQAADVNNCGLYLELDAILAVVVGGTPLSGGRTCLLGTLFGALIIQTLSTSLLMIGAGFEATLVVKAVAVLLVCVMRSPVVHEFFSARRAA